MWKNLWTPFNCKSPGTNPSTISLLLFCVLSSCIAIYRTIILCSYQYSRRNKLNNRGLFSLWGTNAADSFYNAVHGLIFMDASTPSILETLSELLLHHRLQDLSFELPQFGLIFLPGALEIFIQWPGMAITLLIFWQKCFVFRRGTREVLAIATF